MKYVKSLGLAAVAVAALMAMFATGSASATVLCKVNIRPCPTPNEDYPAGTEIHASIAAGGGLAIRDTESNVLITCSESTLKGKTTNTGGILGVPVEGKIETLSFNGAGGTECTSPIKVLKTGGFDIEYIPGTNTRGTLTLKETQITAVLFGGVSCTYGAASVVDAGTVTGTSLGTPATIDFSGVLPKEAGSFLCPSDVRWETTYSITAPKPLYIKEEME
jgi:hypothetical protein